MSDQSRITLHVKSTSKKLKRSDIDEGIRSDEYSNGELQSAQDKSTKALIQDIFLPILTGQFTSGTNRLRRESISESVPFCTICLANIAENSSENCCTVKGCLSDNF